MRSRKRPLLVADDLAEFVPGRHLTDEEIHLLNRLRYGWRLTRHQASVLELVAAGLTNRQVASRLSISPDTVRNLMTTILKTTTSRSRSEAVAKAVRAGFIDVDDGLEHFG